MLANSTEDGRSPLSWGSDGASLTTVIRRLLALSEESLPVHGGSWQVVSILEALAAGGVADLAFARGI